MAATARAGNESGVGIEQRRRPAVERFYVQLSRRICVLHHLLLLTRWGLYRLFRKTFTMHACFQLVTCKPSPRGGGGRDDIGRYKLSNIVSYLGGRRGFRIEGRNNGMWEIFLNRAYSANATKNMFTDAPSAIRWSKEHDTTIAPQFNSVTCSILKLHRTRINKSWRRVTWET